LRMFGCRFRETLGSGVVILLLWLTAVLFEVGNVSLFFLSIWASIGYIFE